jgi:transposase
MSTNKKRKYSKEFKAEAIKLVTEQGYSHSEAGKNLGISHVNISRWVSECRGTQRVSKEKIELSAEQKELEALRKENKRLKMERDILKKAAAFFANESP